MVGAATSAQRADDEAAWRAYDSAWRELLRDEVASRRRFAGAHDAFVACGSSAGARACAAAVLIAIASRHADYRGVGLWLGRFGAAAADPDLPPVVRLRTDVARMCLPTVEPGTGFRDARVVDSAQAVYAVLRSDLALPADERILYAKLLLDHFDLDNDPERFRHVAALLKDSVEDPAASPYWVGVWWWRIASGHRMIGDLEAAKASRERAWALAETHHIADLEYAMVAEEVFDLVARGDSAAASRKVQRMNALAPSVAPVWQGHGMVTEARFLLARNEPEPARELCERALRIYEDTELPDRERDTARSALAQTCLALGEEDEALGLYAAIRANQTGGQRAMLDALELGARAARALRENAPDARARVAAAMAKAREIEWYAFFFTLPALAARLFAAALEHDIEREFVVKAIRQRQLVPPDPTSEHWPWPVRIRALGSFVVERDGEAIAFERKAQKKPLELLKALVAAGGEGVPRETLALALWPDPDADAFASFDVTLSRLRKLIDVEGALVLAEGKLSLGRRVVWCDVVAFDTLCTRLAAALHEGADAAAIEATATAAFALYRDKLFGDEAPARWSIAERERIALRFDRAVADIGAWHEARGEWRAAITRYEHGLAQQMLAEPFYRGLMRCHHALGESTEAMRAFRRCRELLSIVLGVAPSAETEALHRAIRGG